MANSRTGRFAGVGSTLEESLRVAETEINAAGGILGKPIAFKVVDDGSDATTSQSVIDGLLPSGLAGVLGPISSAQALAVQGSLDAHHIVQVSATATSPLLTTAQPQHDRYFFRTVAPDDLQGRAIAKLAHDGALATSGARFGGGCAKASIVNGDDAYGNALGTVAHDAFLANAGTSIVSADKVATAVAANYTVLAQKVVAAKPDCLLLLAYSDVGSVFMRDLKAAIAADTTADWSKFFVAGSDGEYDSAFTPSSGVTDDAYGTSPDPSPSTPDYQAFRTAYQSIYPGKEPGPFAAHQYDAAVLVALAIQSVGSVTDGTKVRDALYAVSRGGTQFGPTDLAGAFDALGHGTDIDYRGASGSVDFDDSGNVKDDYIVWRVTKQPDGTRAFQTVAGIPASEL